MAHYINAAPLTQTLPLLNSEHVGDVYAERKAIFDVYCENERGEKFIVEMQNAKQHYFKDRSLYYATFPIREQAPKGQDWNFKLAHVYVVALLNFDMHEEAFAKDSISHDVALIDKETNKVFNEKLRFKYVEVAKFNKNLDELDTLYDKWIYVLKNLARLNKQPAHLRNAVFDHLFSEAEIASFTHTELKEYEDSLKAYRDIKNSLDTAKDEGRAEGMAKGMAEGMAKGLAKGLAKGMAEGMAKGRGETLNKMVSEMKREGLGYDLIEKLTGLPQKDIDAIP